METESKQTSKAMPWKLPFFTIWTGQAFSLIGSRVVQFALVWWLTQLTGSATVLATATMVALIPEILLSPIAGAQGRVFTMMGSLLWMTSPFSLAVAGPVTDWVGLQVWYVTAGVMCVATGLTGFFVPAIVNIEENNKNGAGAEAKLLPLAKEEA